MSPMRCCARPAAVALAICFLSVIAPVATQAASTKILGTVYYDKNHNGAIDSNDYGIYLARVVLIRDDDPTQTWTVLTDKTGNYAFDIPGLIAGRYDLRTQWFTGISGTTSVGALYNENGTMLTGQVAQDFGGTATTQTNGPNTDRAVFENIYLQNGWYAWGYNFGENTYPIELASKCMLSGGTVPSVPDPGVPDPPSVVPEPGAIALVAAAALIGGLMIFGRRRRLVRRPSPAPAVGAMGLGVSLARW